MAAIRRALVLLAKPGGDLSPWAAASTPALASVGNRTILDWVLADLADAGVEDVGLLVSDATAADVRSVAGDGRAWRLRCSYIEEQASLGTGGALLTAESFLGDAPFIVHFADGLLDEPMRRVLRPASETDADGLLVCARTERGGRPADDRPPLDRALVLVLGPAIYGALRAAPAAGSGETDLGNAIAELERQGSRMRQDAISGWRWDGTPEALLAGNRFALTRLATGDERVVVDPTAQIDASVLRGPSVIGPGARIRDSYVGPYTSVGPDVTIDGAEIEDSIVLAGARISNLGRRLEGRGASLSRGFSLPLGLRIQVGDRAEVVLT